MSEPAILLEARGIAVCIGGHDVCRNLDFSLHAGERMAILGRNGAGKSTLLSTLAGLRPAQSGSVMLAGQEISALSPRDAARLRGWLSQHPADPFASSVLDTALTGRHPHLGRWDWESHRDLDIARVAIADVGLSGLEQRSTQNLSGGERQRAAIAALLTQQPQLYLLDEPLTHLDLNHQIAVLELFSAKAKQEGAAIAMVLHDPALALRYCDSALLLFGNGHAEAGPVADMLNEERLSVLYGHPLRRFETEGRTAFLPL